MNELPEFAQQFVGKHMARILIFLFTMMIGMVVGQSFAHAQIRTPSPTAAAIAKAPVPIVVGIVTSATDASVNITDENNATHTFSLTTATKYLPMTGSNTKPTAKSLTVNTKIAIASDDQTVARLVFVLPNTPSRTAAFLGVVSSREATASGVILSMKNPKEDNFAKAQIGTATKFSAKGIDKPTADDIKAGDKVLVVGNLNSQNIIAAAKAYIIPGKARGLLDKIMKADLPSPVATKSATKSAAPRATTTSDTR